MLLQRIDDRSAITPVNFIKGHCQCRSAGTKDSLRYTLKVPKATKDSSFKAPLQIVEPAVTPRRILLCFPFPSLLLRLALSLYPNDHLYALKLGAFLPPAAPELKNSVSGIRHCLKPRNLRQISRYYPFALLKFRIREQTNSVKHQY